jgi:hypothetical protein
MKTTLVLTAVLAMAAGAALAQTAAAPATPDAGAAKAQRFEQMKSRIEAGQAKRDAVIAERRQERDTLRSNCENQVKAAASPDQLKAIHEQCKGERQAMDQKFKAENQQVKAQRQQAKADWQAKRAALKGAAPAPAAN